MNFLYNSAAIFGAVLALFLSIFLSFAFYDAYYGSGHPITIAGYVFGKGDHSRLSKLPEVEMGVIIHEMQSTQKVCLQTAIESLNASNIQALQISETVIGNTRETKLAIRCLDKQNSSTAILYGASYNQRDLEQLLHFHLSYFRRRAR